MMSAHYNGLPLPYQRLDWLEGQYGFTEQHDFLLELHTIARRLNSEIACVRRASYGGQAGYTLRIFSTPEDSSHSSSPTSSSCGVTTGRNPNKNRGDLYVGDITGKLDGKRIFEV
jgi:hypothetical protein